MFAFTVWGFISEEGRLSDFNVNMFADSPLDAAEKALKHYSNLVVSNVCRANTGRLQEY